MMNNKEKVSNAFSNQSLIFDRIYTDNKLSEYMRSKFREDLLRFLKPASDILELNCGTGMDTLYISSLGHHVTATDNAPGMLEQLSAKVANQHLESSITVKQCDFEKLETLQPAQFDYIYSNFSGLNCTAQLDHVLKSMLPLLKPGGKISVVIMPRICPWENIMLLKGKFKTAFRRLKKGGTDAHIEGVVFKCYYYNPSYVINALKQHCKVVGLKGICITVPPPFIENFVERYPRLMKFLMHIDKRIERLFPFTYCCDQYMITFEKIA